MIYLHIVCQELKETVTTACAHFKPLMMVVEELLVRRSRFRCFHSCLAGVRTDVPSRCLGKNVATFWLCSRLFSTRSWDGPFVTGDPMRKKNTFEHAF